MGTKVTCGEGFRVLLKNGRWSLIEQAAVNPTHPGQRPAYVTVQLSMRPSILVDFKDPVSAAMLAGLVATGLIVQADADEIAALS
jgi:hypothetical protein